MKKNIDLKTKILNESFRLFLTENFEKVTIEDIEKATNRTRGAIFYHFKNKQHLFETIIKDIYFAEMKKFNSAINLPVDIQYFFDEYKSPCERIISHIKTFDKEINAEKAFFHLTLQASMYYPNFDAIYSKIANEEHILLSNILSHSINNISNNDLKDIIYLFLNISYSNTFNNAFSSLKNRSVSIPYLNDKSNIKKIIYHS
ncbi:MAG: TetR/AcrR family transcriptional regulator [Prevotellaceae bacterium]|jgi:AcrR family transcriptional regulator|nr:TetR/AcrR family transcriptional regulator [Prevotellaceae bacterium]